eukprot:COSAG02_NODE_43384_length_375_cov_0.931159_1_plen_69_part_10
MRHRWQDQQRLVIKRGATTHQQTSAGNGNDATRSKLKPFRELLECRELADALTAMDVHAPNQMQAVRCH